VGRLPGARRRRGRYRLTAGVRTVRAALLLALLASCVSCHAPRSSDDVTSTWVLDPAAPRTGAETRIILVLRDPAGAPIRNATLQMAARTSLQGMAPIVADAIETVPGSYAVDVQLTTGGDWTVVASGTLADGRRLTRSVDVKNVR